MSRRGHSLRVTFRDTFFKETITPTDLRAHTKIQMRLPKLLTSFRNRTAVASSIRQVEKAKQLWLQRAKNKKQVKMSSTLWNAQT
jgi:hypothetical protein